MTVGIRFGNANSYIFVLSATKKLPIYPMIVLDDYNVILSNRNDIGILRYRWVSFVSTNRFASYFLELFRVAKLLNKRTAEQNAQLRQQLATYKLMIESLKTVDLKGRDLSEIITSIEAQILVCIEHKNDIDKMLAKNISTKLFTHFGVTQRLTEELIESLYLILRHFKKNTIKRPLQTSQLAINTANHSEKILTEIINGN